MAEKEEETGSLVSINVHRMILGSILSVTRGAQGFSACVAVEHALFSP